MISSGEGEGREKKRSTRIMERSVKRSEHSGNERIKEDRVQRRGEATDDGLVASMPCVCFWHRRHGVSLSKTTTTFALVSARRQRLIHIFVRSIGEG